MEKHLLYLSIVAVPCSDCPQTAMCLLCVQPLNYAV